MSIFNENIHHPVEELYDQCKDVVGWIVPMNMMHYNGDCETMKHDIVRMLRERNLLVNNYNSALQTVDSVNINKVSKVIVEYGEYVRRIPTYKVRLFYVKEIHSDLWFGGRAIEYTAFLTQFNVGISGIINESVQ